MTTPHLISKIDEPVDTIARKQIGRYHNKFQITKRLSWKHIIALQMDTCTLDVRVKDIRPEGFRNEDGTTRMFQSTAIECNSRNIVAAVFTYDEPDANVIKALLRLAFIEMGCKPDEVWMDRGKQYISDDVASMLKELDIKVVKCPPHRLQHKGIIEHLFDIENKQLWSLERGYIDNNPQNGNPKAIPTKTISQIRDTFWEWKKKEYDTHYGGLGCQDSQLSSFKVVSCFLTE